MSPLVRIKPEEQKLFSDYIKKLTGIHLDPSKAYLLETRLSAMMRRTSSPDFAALYKHITADATRQMEKELVDAITTGETLFFRDRAPFDLLKHKILPDLIDRRNGGSLNKPLTLNILSAACSTGQEVYSIAIVLKELLGDPFKHRIRLLGVDISDEAVARASYGEYNGVEIARGLPQEVLRRYFHEEGKKWRVKDEIRAMATFRKENLLQNFSHLGSFDIIFCRNVAIYFEENHKRQLFGGLSNILKDDGYLIIGSTESISTLCPNFESKRHMRSVYYQKREPGRKGC